MKFKGEIVGKEPYAVGEHQEFTNRKGERVRVVRGQATPVPVGQAYAFFDCTTSKREIEGEIPTIRDLTQVPNELELHLTEGTTSFREEGELKQLMGEAREAGMRYVMKAQYPTATNRQAADELAAVLNQAYQSPLFRKGEPFRGAIFYNDQNRYVARE